jgi:hypothetical protein
MASNKDVFIAGNLLIQQHGDEAESIAMEKILLMKEDNFNVLLIQLESGNDGIVL